jgi:DNA processing protein
MNDQDVTPDMSLSEQLALLQLNLIPGVGPRTQTVLLEHFGSARAVLQARGTELLEVPGIGGKLSATITAAADCSAAQQEWASCERLGVQLVFRGEEAYPEPLRHISDPPSLLYCRGTLLPADALAVAIVGSRQCSRYGKQIAARLAGELGAAGVTVVSGLARGIDAAAHQGALQAGGRTIAVCATGLSEVYPPEHLELAGRISEQGALVSESPLHRPPLKALFPQRNRIIAGMSQAVVLIEAGRTSGALHTARHAQEQGREVLAVPGQIDSPYSLGCLDLLRDGATLVRCVDDILEALGPLTKPVQKDAVTVVHAPRELLLNEQELSVLNLLSMEPITIDELLANAPLPAARVLSTLTVLEMKRLVQRLPGGFIVRTGR